MFYITLITLMVSTGTGSAVPYDSNWDPHVRPRSSDTIPGSINWGQKIQFLGDSSSTSGFEEWLMKMVQFVTTSPLATYSGRNDMQVEKLGPMGDAMLEAWLIRHCAASTNNSTTIRECVECFGQYKPDDTIKPAQCITQYLHPQYEECRQLVLNATTSVLEVFMCFRAKIKYLDFDNCLQQVGISSITTIQEAALVKHCLKSKKNEFRMAIQTSLMDKLSGGSNGCGLTVLALMSMLPMSPQQMMRPNRMPPHKSHKHRMEEIISGLLEKIQGRDDKPKYLPLVPFEEDDDDDEEEDDRQTRRTCRSPKMDDFSSVGSSPDATEYLQELFSLF